MFFILRRSRQRRDSTPSTRQDCPPVWSECATASGRAATTRRRRGGGRLPPRPDATDGPPYWAAPGRSGCLGRVGRDSPRAVAPERLAGGRVRPYLRQPQLSQSSLDCTSTKKTRFSRSEGSSGRVYTCMDGSCGGTAHHLPVLLAKVNRPARRVAVTRGLKAAHITEWPHTQQIKTESAGSTVPGKLLLHSEQHSMHQRAAARRPWVWGEPHSRKKNLASEAP